MFFVEMALLKVYSAGVFAIYQEQIDNRSEISPTVQPDEASLSEHESRGRTQLTVFAFELKRR